MVIFHNYVSLPEGTKAFSILLPSQALTSSWLHGQRMLGLGPSETLAVEHDLLLYPGQL